MNDRQLSSFIKIAETGSFSRAAMESFISVPAIVQQIDRLEEALGFALFSRSNQGVELTDGGKVFYKAVLDMREIYERTVAEIRDKEQDSINIGVAGNQCPEFLINACSEFRSKNPQTVLHFIELPYELHLEMLRQGKIDLTVIAKPKKSFLKDLEYRELCQDTCAFGVNKGHALGEKELIQLKDLCGMKVLCGAYHYMETSFEQLLKGGKAHLQPLNTEYNLESCAQAKFSDAMLVFHSRWKNCYSHMFRVLPSDISAGSIGVVMRKGDSVRLEALVDELYYQQKIT